MQRRAFVVGGLVAILVVVAWVVVAWRAQATRSASRAVPDLALRRDDERPPTRPARTAADMHHAVISDEPSLVLAGQVLFADGNEAAGATIFLSLQPVGVADAHGWFSFVVAPGRYAVAARANDACGALEQRVYVGLDKNESLLDPILIVLDGGRALTGTVRDESGRAIVGATVDLDPNPDTAHPTDDIPAVTTDASGHFRLAGICGAARLTIAADGYLHAEYGVGADERADLDITLSQSAQLVAHVVDENRAPILGAYLVLFDANHRMAGSNRDWVPPWERRPNDNGTFVITDLPPGTLQVRVSTPNHGALDRTITLAAGEQRDETFVVPGGTILRGRVVDDHGAPAGGVDVHSINSRTTTTPDGRFSLRAIEPSDRIVAEQTTPHAFAALAITIDASTPLPDPVVLVLRRTDRTLSGQVTYNDGAPAVGVTILVAWPFGVGAGGATETTGADGRFLFRELANGTCRVTVKSAFATVDERSVACDAENLRIAIPRPATVRGTVSGAAPNATIAVRLENDDGRDASAAVALLDGAGRFVLNNVAPGRYAVIASDAVGDSSPVALVVGEGASITGVQLMMPARSR